MSQNDNYTFSRLMAYHTEQMKGKLKPGTLKNYTATEKYIKAFIKRKFRRDDIYLIQLDYAFITELETYIPNNPFKGHDICTASNSIYPFGIFLITRHGAISILDGHRNKRTDITKFTDPLIHSLIKTRLRF